MSNEIIVMAPAFGVESEPGVYTRSLENPALSLSDPRAWEEAGFFGKSDSGVSVTSRTALQYSPVWQAVNLISGDVAKLPLNVYRRMPELGESAREKDSRHPAQRLLRRQANNRMHAFQFWRRLMVHVLIWNNAYALIERNARGPVSLLPLCPDRTYYKSEDDVYVSEINGEIFGFRPSEILHLEGISVDGDDCELVYNARNSWALGLAAEKFASKFFANGAKTSGILEVPLGMPKKSVDNLREGFYKSQSGLDNAFKTVILRDGAKFHEASVTPRDGLLSEVRVEQVKEVARWYNLPPHKLGISDQSSYNSLEQENRSYLQGTLSHWLCTIKAESELKLLSSEETDNDTHFIEHNTRALLQTDTETQVTIGVQGVTNGLFTRNEWRATQNMNPVEGGDVLIMPLNMTEVGQADEDDEPADEETERSLTLQTRVLESLLKDSVQAAVRAVKKESGRKTLNRFNEWYNKRTWQPKLNEVLLEPLAVLTGRETREVLAELQAACSAEFDIQIQAAIAQDGTANAEVLTRSIVDAANLAAANYLDSLPEIVRGLKNGTAND